MKPPGTRHWRRTRSSIRRDLRASATQEYPDLSRKRLRRLVRTAVREALMATAVRANLWAICEEKHHLWTELRALELLRGGAPA